MSLDKVKNALAPLGLEGRVMAFTTSSATVETAAQAVGCQPAHIAKTLSFLLEEGPIVVVMAGDTKIDNPKYKQRFHQKARMIPAEQVEVLVGYPVGGVCPFALPQGVSVYLDESLRRFESVYPAGGTPASAVRLTPQELEMASGASAWVDVGRQG